MSDAVPGDHLQPGQTQPGQDGEVSPVWPPPPTIDPPPPPSALLPVFTPLTRLSWVVTVLLGASALLSVAELAAASLPPVSFQQVTAGVDVLQALLLLVTGICFLVWTYRLSRNTRAFGVAGLQFTPAWAVGYFFVPVVSLYRPYQIFREIWRASDPGPTPRSGLAWQNIRPPALLGFWWGSWLVSTLTDRLAAQTPNDLGASVVGAAVSLVSAVLAVSVVRLYTARQEKTARLLSLPL